MAYRYTPPTSKEIAAGGLALREYVGAEADNKEFSEETFTQAHALVHTYVAGRAGPPESVIAESIKEVGSKLWARRGTQGNTGFGNTLDAAPMLAAKDPMVTVYPVLNVFLPGGFA